MEVRRRRLPSGVYTAGLGERTKSGAGSMSRGNVFPEDGGNSGTLGWSAYVAVDVVRCATTSGMNVRDV